jgi:hypothetical protein
MAPDDWVPADKRGLGFDTRTKGPASMAKRSYRVLCDLGLSSNTATRPHSIPVGIL